MLKIEHLKKHFGNQVVLDDINLEIKKGRLPVSSASQEAERQYCSDI